MKFETVGMAIKIARVEANLRQRDVARELGIDPWVLSKIERGVQQVPKAWIKRLPAAIRSRVREAMIDEIEREFGGGAMSDLP